MEKKEIETNDVFIQYLTEKIYGKSKGKKAFEIVKKLIEENKLEYNLNNINRDTNYNEKNKNIESNKIKKTSYFSNDDIYMITYGDTLKEKSEKPLITLEKFLKKYLKGIISHVHILPFFPYSSDDGFSVIDYYKVNPELGDWQDVKRINENFKLMFDFVLNHVSSKSEWFQNYLEEKEGFKKLAIEVDPDEDLTSVVRPRALPLLTKFIKKNGKEVWLWTTFSADQIDVNFKDLDTFKKMIEVLIYYVKKGAQVIRLDAIAYLWKEIGTSCIHLHQVHYMVKLFRIIVNSINPETIIITETNVPHKENISYFGNGHDEAQMVYNFTLPPLLLYTFIEKDSTLFSKWVETLRLPSSETTFFNFTASHDGIGVRPLEGIVDEKGLNKIIEHVKRNNGRVSYKTNSDGSKSAYELNITYVDAFKFGENDSLHAKRFIAGQSIALVLPGVPAFYIHSLLGSHNWNEGVEKLGYNRAINREKLNFEKIEKQLQDKKSFRYEVFNEITKLIRIRRKDIAFHPNGNFKIFNIDKRVFSILREYSKNGKSSKVLVIVNITSEKFEINLKEIGLNDYKYDIITKNNIVKNNIMQIEPYGIYWLK